MKCEELLKLLSEYIDGEVDPAVCEQFEEHLKGCDPCNVVIDTMRMTVQLYKDDEIYEIPIEFRERLHDVLREKWDALDRHHSE